MTGAYFAAGPCCFCGEVFSFDPERVPAIPLDARGAPHPEGVKHPICAPCMAKVNLLREEHGERPIPILPGAYSPREGFPP
jgi:hypothetical protein